MFTILRVEKATANKGIYHARKNGDFVEELFRKDAEVVYEVTDKCSNYFGTVYAFFVIEVQEGDILRYNGSEYPAYSFLSAKRDSIYWNSCRIIEMFYNMSVQGKPFPKNTDDLLKDNLQLIFRRVIKWKSRGYESNTIWENYAPILEELGKNANEYVEQETVDKFLAELIAEKELRQVERMTKSPCITFSEENQKAYEEAKKAVADTIIIAKELLAGKGREDVIYNVGGDPVCHFYLESTPCGQLGIRIDLSYGDFNVMLVFDNNGSGYDNTFLDVSKECQEFAKNFKQTA